VKRHNHRLLRGTCHLTLLLVLSGLAAEASAAKPKAPRAPDPSRVAELATMLPKEPRGLGRPITDRQPWRAVAEAPEFKDVVKEAESLMSQAIPELTDDLFLDFSRTGNRTRCQRVYFDRRKRLVTLVLAECIENRGRFLPAIEEVVRTVCAENTWLLPAHDRKLRNFNKQVVEIDLFSAGTSWDLATAHYWLGDKLSPDVRKLIQSELQRRIFQPFETMITTDKLSMWWLRTTNNWNAVCLAGVTGSALAVMESPQRRAFVVASAEKYIQNFLGGFTPDGYCSEGIGYWNYGFGNYVMLAESVYQATGGKLDMFDDPRVKQDALFGRRIEIRSGVYPSFADCGIGAKPAPYLMAFLSRRYGLGLAGIEKQHLLLGVGEPRSLYQFGVFGFPNSASKRPPAKQEADDLPPRDWFADAGILICRPQADNSRGLAAALKGGHNAEHHNHNDVGSFVVVSGKTLPLLDPGGEVYTRRTFSSQRYVSGVLNSFGHPVPRVAGKLQRTGRSAAGKVLKTDFTDRTDTLVLDISSAYDVKPLKKLRRTFVFSREGTGSLTVTDEVEFSSPQTFGNALITFSKWKRAGDDRLVVGEGSEAVNVRIAAAGEQFRLEAEEIKEDLSRGRIPVRLGIDLVEPVTKATITLTITK